MLHDKYRKLTENWLHPYLSYRQWEQLLDELRVFTPERLDTCYFADLGFSRSSRSMLRCALVFFGLMSPEGTPRAELKELLNADAETRATLLKNTARNAYAQAFARLDPAYASRSQIREYLRSVGVTGEIGRKCRAILMAIAADARIRPSPHIDRSSQAREVRKTKPEHMSRHGAVRTTQRDTRWARALVDKFPNFDSLWSDELKKKWFEDFRELSHLDMLIVGRGSG